MREREFGWPGFGLQVEIDAQQLAADCRRRVAPPGHQVSTDQSRGRHRDLMNHRVMRDLSQKADLFEFLQLGDYARMRIGESKLLRLFDGAVPAEIHQRSQEGVSAVIQQQEPLRKTNAHEYPHSSNVVVVDCGSSEPLWNATHGTARTVLAHGR